MKNIPIENYDEIFPFDKIPVRLFILYILLYIIYIVSYRDICSVMQ